MGNHQSSQKKPNHPTKNSRKAKHNNATNQPEVDINNIRLLLKYLDSQLGQGDNNAHSLAHNLAGLIESMNSLQSRIVHLQATLAMDYGQASTGNLENTNNTDSDSEASESGLVTVDKEFSPPPPRKRKAPAGMRSGNEGIRRSSRIQDKKRQMVESVAPAKLPGKAKSPVLRARKQGSGRIAKGKKVEKKGPGAAKIYVPVGEVEKKKAPRQFMVGVFV